MVYNTRIAPSPTGLFHIGTARTAYFNYLAARATGGKFLLRIDDTDAERNQESHVKVIMDALGWLGIDCHKTFRQSERLPYYRSVAYDMVKENLAYNQDGCIVLRPKIYPKQWADKISGVIKSSQEELENLDKIILVRSNGTATYNFASIMDDMRSNINLIIRGVDHIPNTLKQIAIMANIELLFGTDIRPIEFAHVGLIHKDGKKMSKRDGASNILDYKDKGYLPEAVLNFILRMGWSPTNPNSDKLVPIINKDKATEMFINEGRMKASPAKFDQDRLDWYQRRYTKLR